MRDLTGRAVDPYVDDRHVLYTKILRFFDVSQIPCISRALGYTFSLILLY